MKTAANCYPIESLNCYESIELVISEPGFILPKFDRLAVAIMVTMWFAQMMIISSLES